MYGGGFATVPAYLADMFGTQFVGAIHGRLLTAWSTAGILGPVVVNYIREFAARRRRAARPGLQRHHVHPRRHAGAGTDLQLHDQAGRQEVAHERGGSREAAGGKRQDRRRTPSGSFGIGKGGLDAPALLFWAFVGIPAPGASGSR